jgi:pimeloyl-ACP methyl ester carboxylesterase
MQAFEESTAQPELPDERFCRAGEIELCYETFGDPADPALLLVMGLGTQMLGWPAGFCRELAARGFRVIRYDNRDVGRSTWLGDHAPPTFRELFSRRIRNPAYALEDMAADGVGLLDALGIGTAHVVGASLGGMIAQVMAVRHPDRIASLVSIMSSTGNRWKGQPAARVYPFFLMRPRRSKRRMVRRLLRLAEAVGSTGFERDVDELRAMLELSHDRGANPAGILRQLGASIVSGDRTRELQRVHVPTLVIHGTVDRLVRPSGGRATARAIRGARHMMIEGMGHDFPRGVWPQIGDAIADNASRATPRPAIAGSAHA